MIPAEDKKFAQTVGARISGVPPGKVQRAVLRRQGVADAVDVLGEREERRA